jgi:lysozyme
MNTKLYDLMIPQLTLHEGSRDDVYVDSTGNRTIGIGHNLDATGLSEEAIYCQLVVDMDSAERMLEVAFEREVDDTTFHGYPLNIQRVLMDMMFNLGPRKFMGFKRMIAAVKNRRWGEMKEEMLDSKWATQVQSSRVEYLTELVDIEREGSLS